MALTSTLARRAYPCALTAVLSLALIALPAQVRADAGEQGAAQSGAEGSATTQSASLTAPSSPPSPEATDAPEPAAPNASSENRAGGASSVSDEAPTMGASDEIDSGAWMRNSVGWWWRRSDGTYPSAQWVEIGGSRYYFNASGYMATGWQRLDDGWHFFAASGAQMGGWVRDGGEWYYLDPNTGIMRTAPLEQGGRRYEFDASGAWLGYEAPAGYLQPTDHITGLAGATNTLTWGMNGTKVRIAQVRLGLWHSSKLASVDAPFVAAVKNFQQRMGLPVTGVVDEATWDAMDTGYPWTVDQYQATPLPLTARRSERIEAMIGYAWNQTGSSYTWGGAGPYDQGFDCSGLVLQSLYRAGLDPQPIDVIKHAWPSYRTSQELYAYPYFQHVPLGQRQRGDLIFYKTGGVVTHVAIYLGDDLIVHTDWMGRPARMQHITAGYGWDRMTPDVVRPLP